MSCKIQEKRSRPRPRSLEVERKVREWRGRRGMRDGHFMSGSGLGDRDGFMSSLEERGEDEGKSEDKGREGIGGKKVSGGGVNGNGNGNMNDTNTYDEMLNICWAKQECWSCLDTKSGVAEGDQREGGGSVVCSWCYASQTCIPNPIHPSLLAPFVNPDICPLWYERWELRTKPLGCHVSTITVMAVVIAVLVTMFMLSVVAACTVCVRRWNRERRGWWKVWRYRVVVRDLNPRRGRERWRERRNGNDGVREGDVDGERRSLLGDAGVE